MSLDVLADLPSEELSPLSAVGWTLPIPIFDFPSFKLTDPLLAPQATIPGAFHSRLDFDQPLGT